MSAATVGQDPAFTGEVKIPGPPAESPQAEIQGRWPRMLELDEDVESRLTQYLDNEISLCWQERDLLTRDWIQWQRDYWAKPSEKIKNFPFRRAANVIIPMTAIAVESVLANLITTIFSVKPFYSIRPRIPAWVKAAPEVEQWLQTEVEDPQALDMEGFARESLLELIKLGTGVGKSGYVRDIRKVNIDVPGGSTVPRWVERRNGATLDYVPLANFLLRLHEKDPQDASWVGEEHINVTWAMLKRNALSGRMKPEAIDKIKAWWSQTGNMQSSGQAYDDARRGMEGSEPAWKEVFNFCEVWLGFDVDGDGVDEEIVVELHKESRTILSCRYNWYKDLHRPYRIGVYIPVEGRWAGIGIGKQLEQFQALITTVHRQRLDAGTLANMGMMALKKTSGYTSDEPIWPGKMWFLDNPQTDIKEFHLSNTQHFSQIQNEDSARQYADKRSGVNELVLGTPHQGTPGTATTDLAKLAEGKKKFDMVLKNVRRWFGLLGLDALANYQQFGSRGRSWMVRGDKGAWVEKFLTMPQEEIRRGAFVELTVTDSITNKDVEQQKWQGLFAILTAHYDKAMERSMMVAQVLQDPTIFLMFAEMSLKASNEAITRLVEAFGVVDTDSFLLDLDALMAKNQSAQPGTGQGSQAGAGGGGNGVSPAAGGQQSATAIGAGSNGTGAGSGVSIDEG